MKNSLILISILICALVLRIWQINIFPPKIASTIVIYRYLSAFINTLSIIVLFLYAKKEMHSAKKALLSSFIFSVLPWSVVQSRISSQVNNALFVLLLMLLIIQHQHNKIIKIIIFLFSIFFICLFYPQLWIIKSSVFQIDLKNLVSNIFFLTSSELFFFINPTFWWGGVRDVGIMYLSFTPLLAVGLYLLVLRKKYQIFFCWSVILLISAVSPLFPESQEYYLVLPFLSVVTAEGLYRFWHHKSLLLRSILILIILSFVYEMAQFMHYYYIHYPVQIINNQEKIHEAF